MHAWLGLPKVRQCEVEVKKGALDPWVNLLKGCFFVMQLRH